MNITEDTLSITVRTEDDVVREHVTPDGLREVIARLGRDGDRYAVVERIPEEPEEFVQVWRAEPGSVYEVEARDGGPDRHVAVRLRDAARVASLFVGWARREAGWGDGLDWQAVDLSSTPGLEPAVRQAVEEYARQVVGWGVLPFQEAARAVSEYFDPRETPVSVVEAGRILAPLWREREAEQAGWPETTDPDRVAEVFAELEAEGITARADFACCTSCGHAEIASIAAEQGARGYVFFHRQDTERVAAGGSLWLAWGSCSPTGDARAVAREVADALTAAGLEVDWDGSAESGLRLPSVKWLKRLPR